MWVVFFSERYDADGGANDLVGVVESLSEETLLPFIMQYIVGKLLGSYHTYSGRDVNSTALSTNLIATFLNLEEKKRHFAHLWIDRSGQEIQLSGKGGGEAAYCVDEYPDTALPFMISYHNEK